MQFKNKKLKRASTKVEKKKNQQFNKLKRKSKNIFENFKTHTFEYVVSQREYQKEEHLKV